MGYLYLYQQQKIGKLESWKGGKKNQKESLEKIEKNPKKYNRCADGNGQTKSWGKSCYFDDDA